MTTHHHIPVTAADINHLERVVAEAARTHDELVGQRQKLLDSAEDYDKKAAAVEASRRDLLDRAFEGDKKVDAELMQTEPQLQALRHRGEAARAKAARLDPAIAEAAKPVRLAAKALNELRHKRLVEEHARDAAALHDGLGPLLALIDAYVKSGAALIHSHRNVFGEPEPREGYEPAAFRALRFLNIQLHRHYPEDLLWLALEQRFPPEAGKL
jgi:chromosome segregation ATPase